MHTRLLAFISIPLYLMAVGGAVYGVRSEIRNLTKRVSYLENKSGPGQPNGSETVMTNLAPIQSNQDSTMHNSGSASKNFKIDLRDRNGKGATYTYEKSGALKTTIRDKDGTSTKVTY